MIDTEPSQNWKGIAQSLKRYGKQIQQILDQKLWEKGQKEEVFKKLVGKMVSKDFPLLFSAFQIFKTSRF